MIQCYRCQMRKKFERWHQKGVYPDYGASCSTRYGTFAVTAAEMLIRLNPRAPIQVTARMLGARFRAEAWQYVKRHLPHVDNSKPGIMAQLLVGGHLRLYLIEGFHRATNHMNAQTDWSCYVLTPEETHAILVPPE